MLADNRLSETSSWDDQLLAETLRDLSLQDLDFELEVTGFDIGEIDFRIEGLSLEPVGITKNDPADALPSPALIPSSAVQATSGSSAAIGCSAATLSKRPATPI